MGRECVKCPLDLWIYQEILFELRPKVVYENGTCAGGTSLFLAHVMDILGRGIVVTTDWDHDPSRPDHPRMFQNIGDTLDPETLKRATAIANGASPRMLILDDGHSEEHVFAELELWGPMLRTGDYLVVEDTNLGGPLWGLERYLAKHPGRFARDESRERLLMTQNPKGYWRCVA